MKRWLVWIALVVLVIAYVGANRWTQEPSEESQEAAAKRQAASKAAELKKATLTPGRVVSLQTNKGLIEFVLFEKDCPITTKRVAGLVARGRYNGIAFSRVEKTGLIQTALAKSKLRPIRLEVLEGLTHAKGAVGMARQTGPHTGTSSFYILTEPWPHLDSKYAVFGRLINGMDVAMKIKVGDKIDKATLRPFTKADRKRFETVLTIESERKTQ